MNAGKEQDSLGIGTSLREARLAGDDALADIAAHLKIREVHLQALEDEDFASLPGDVYVIGFIRTYANHLQLNSADLTERYKKSLQGVKIEESGFIIEEENTSLFSVWRVSIVLGVVLGAGFVWLLLATHNEGAGNDTINRVPPLATSTPIEQKTKPAQTETKTTAQETITQETKTVAALPPKIEIRATARTWMRIESDQGQVLFSSIVNRGDGFALLTDRTYILATRDAGALGFFNLGADTSKISNVGRRGQILSGRRITPAAIARGTAQE